MNLTKKSIQKKLKIKKEKDKKYPNYRNPKDFITVLKQSIRMNDSVVIKDVDQFYIYLQKTRGNEKNRRSAQKEKE